MRAALLLLHTFTTYAWFLPPPRRVSVESVNMRHVLKWQPLQSACNTTLLYSVQFQGEFELQILDGRWVDVQECQLTPHTSCDLSFDLGSDSDYNVQVRGQCGTRVSPWAKLSRPFNRRDTMLSDPEMSVTAEGGSMQVWFKDIPSTAAVSVSVWKKGEEWQVATYRVPAEQTPLHITTLLEEGVYCIRAQLHLGTQRQSSSTYTRCIAISGPAAFWMKPATLTVTVVFTAGFLLAVFWVVVHCRTETCQAYFLKEPLPSSLQPGGQMEKCTLPEEVELCQPCQPVLLSDLHQSAAEVQQEVSGWLVGGGASE